MPSLAKVVLALSLALSSLAATPTLLMLKIDPLGLRWLFLLIAQYNYLFYSTSIALLAVALLMLHSAEVPKNRGVLSQIENKVSEAAKLVQDAVALVNSLKSEMEGLRTTVNKLMEMSPQGTQARGVAKESSGPRDRRAEEDLAKVLMEINELLGQLAKELERAFGAKSRRAQR